MSVNGTDSGRRRFLLGSTSVLGAAGVVGAAVPFVSSWQPSARAQAAGAPIRVDIGRLELGAMLGPIPAWRGRPIFVVRRTPEALEALPTINNQLQDPESDRPEQPEYARNVYRSRDPGVLVLIGICPHLGCSPAPRLAIRPEPFEANWKGGFFCACHGSKFDIAGRVYNNSPASRNMEVPPHYYETDNVLVIGEDEETA